MVQQTTLAAASSLSKAEIIQAMATADKAAKEISANPVMDNGRKTLRQELRRRGVEFASSIVGGTGNTVNWVQAAAASLRYQEEIEALRRALGREMAAAVGDYASATDSADHDRKEMGKRKQEQSPKKCRGRVKWFDPERGCGYIEREDGGGEVFVQSSAIRDDCKTLSAGEIVHFEIVEGVPGSCVKVRMGVAPIASASKVRSDEVS